MGLRALSGVATTLAPFRSLFSICHSSRYGKSDVNLMCVAWQFRQGARCFSSVHLRGGGLQIRATRQMMEEIPTSAFRTSGIQDFPRFVKSKQRRTQDRAWRDLAHADVRNRETRDNEKWAKKRGARPVGPTRKDARDERGSTVLLPLRPLRCFL